MARAKRGAACCLCLLILLLPLFAPAEPGPLSAAELLAWREDIWDLMTRMEPQNDPAATFDPEGEERFLFAYSFGTAEVLSPEVTEGAAEGLAEAEVVTKTVACPRGIAVGDSLERVLAAYPNENAALAGDRAYAALYTRGEAAGESGWGWVLRNGQAVECVQYAVACPAEGMEGYYLDLNLWYIMGGGRVTAIRATGFSDLITGEEAAANLEAARDIAGRADFVPDISTAQADGHPLSPEDMSFAGFALAEATRDDVIQALGEPLSEALDGTGYVSTLEYPGALVEFFEQEGRWRLRAILVTGDTLLGPRGIQIGDSTEQVAALFGGAAEDRAVYACEDDAGRTYTLSCTFYRGTLMEYLVTVQ